MSKVLITGSGKRLGKGLALEFAKKGWDVAVHCNSSFHLATETMNEINKLNCNSIILNANLQNFDEVKNLFIKMITEFGVPDVLVNNAGVFPKKRTLSNLSIDEWQETLDTNLNSVLYTSKIFGEIANDGAKIVNIASIGGLEIWNGRIPYNVSKSALITLTEALARELAPKITVNCVSPGTIEIANEPASEKLISIDNIPAKRYGTVYDIFEAVYFFATSNNYITGNNLIVDGAYRFAR